MADLIPSLSGGSDDDREERDPRVIGLDSEEADDFLGAISSSTARSMLSALHESPATPSDLATEVDTSLQNVQYHLGNLSDAGLIEVTGTRYSEKGREMNVYAPSDRALVVVAGRDEETKGLKSALSRLIGGVGVLGIGAAVVNRLARTGPITPFAMGSSASGGDGGGGDGAVSTGNASTTTEYDGANATTTSGQSDTIGTESTTTSDGGDVGISEATTTDEATWTAGDEGTQTVTEEATRTATEEATETAVETATSAPTETATSTPMPTAEPAATETAATETVTTTQYVTDTAVELTTASSGVADAIGSLSPGALFFLGGLTVLVAWVTLGLLRS
ncbi:winged helix-turn-helix domain-containing protein [Haloferax larsenii]|uniref:Winged helix-turn-helix domain-containing protein n=1 Tax=Haloferax larsenii TaxID=302484 RepID=A0ABY5RJT6_HALLR|nr:winged helix-turn-helix domain-containing protein [Haloferax larsenii]UVE51842.1 winged helix-turn-helix domain-containing protein [Haloferax larsenii]